MAVLSKIRQRSLFLIIVIALALFSFVLADLFRNTDSLSGGSENTVATINGVDIDRVEFNKQVENQRRNGRPNISETQIKNQIYNQKLREILFDSELDAIGYSVEEDNMRNALQTNFASFTEFQNEAGVFDTDRLNAFISNLKDIYPDSGQIGGFRINYQQWIENEQNIAKGIGQQSYLNMVKGGIYTSLSEAKQAYLDEAEKVDIEYVQIPFRSIPDSVIKVSKSDLKNFIKKNEKQYQVEATRKIKLVTFEEKASLEDEQEISQKLVSLLKDEPSYNEVSKLTDTIIGFENTTNIAEYVNGNSDVKYADTFTRKKDLNPVFADSIFNSKVGSIYGPYKDKEYFKLTKVLEEKSMPDSSEVRHILIPYVGAFRATNPQYTKEEAKQVADSVAGVLKSNRSKFSDLLEFSTDPSKEQNKGVFKMAYNSGFAPEFLAFGFENKKGAIEVVETNFGYHIIEILNQNNFNTSRKLATIARKIESSEKTNDKIYEEVSNFEIELSNNKDFDELSKEKNLKPRQVDVGELEERILGLGNQRQIVRWAYDENTQIGDYKRFTVNGVGYAVVKLEGVTNKGLMSVEKASSTALVEFRKEKKAELILNRIKGNTLEEIAKNESQSVKSAKAISLTNNTLSGAGLEPKVIGTSLGLDVNQLSKPIIGNQGVYIVKVSNRTEATPLDSYASYLSRIDKNKKNSVQFNVFNALKEKATIEDNRSKTVY